MTGPYTDGWAYNDWWGVLYYDAGPYLGPWPPVTPGWGPYPPPPLPDDANEVDYLIGVPNDVDGALVQVDYDYTNNIAPSFADIWTWHVTPGSSDYRFGTYGRGYGIAPDTPPDGYHLFVLWYNQYGDYSNPPQPSVAPLALVGPSLVAGGYGTDPGAPPPPPPTPAPGIWLNMALYSNGSYFTSQWLADMGPYIGDWPLMPPGETTGAVANSSVSFVLGLPNPAHPDDPSYAFTYSYDTQMYWAIRNIQSPGPPLVSTEAWSTGSMGSAPSPYAANGDRPPPGYHIYVVVSGFTPPLPPQAYVPRTYAAAGTANAYTAPGGWSDWQPAFTVRRPALWCSAGGYLIDGPTANYPNDTPALNSRWVDTSNEPGASAAIQVGTGNPTTDMSRPPSMGGTSSYSDAVWSTYPPGMWVALATFMPILWSWIQNDLAHAVDPATGNRQQQQANTNFGWNFIGVINRYQPYTSFLPLYMIFTEGGISLFQTIDTWQAQTKPVAPPDDPNYTGPLVYGVDYTDPPFGYFPNTGGIKLIGGAYSYGPGVGFPAGADHFDHELPKAVPEWQNIASYLTPVGAAVGVGGGNEASGHSAPETHSEVVDVFVGSPPLICGGSTKVYSQANEAAYLATLPYSQQSPYTTRQWETDWVNPGLSGLVQAAQFSLGWTCDGVGIPGVDQYGDATFNPAPGTLTSPAGPVGVAFGDLIPYGTEQATVLMQPHSATTGVQNPAMWFDPGIWPGPGHAQGVNDDTGASSAPSLNKDFYGAYISDPYVPPRPVNDFYHSGKSLTWGVPTLMHEPRWRYWQPDKIVIGTPPEPPAVIDDWLRLNQRGDRFSRDPSIRLGSAQTSAAKAGSIRVGDRNNFR